MAGFSQTMQGDWSKFRNQLNKLAKINYKKMHEQIGEALVANAQLRFRDQVDPEGRPWPKGHKSRGQTLTRTARLSSSITHKATAKQVEYGTNVKYARIHQFGGTIRAKKAKFLKFKTEKGWVQKKKVVIPARPFIGFSDDDLADIKEIYEKTQREALK